MAENEARWPIAFSPSTLGVLLPFDTAHEDSPLVKRNVTNK